MKLNSLGTKHLCLPKLDLSGGGSSADYKFAPSTEGTILDMSAFPKRLRNVGCR